MKQRIFKCNWIRPELAGIHLVDKCLILFMTILLIQSACTLLGFPGNTAQANEIDVIIRTSSAAIFGYFLSANFIRNGASGSGQQETARMGDGGLREQSVEGVFTEKELAAEEGAENKEEHPVESGRLQILIAAAVGLFCLFTLILLRNAGGWGEGIEASPSATATVAQFRDFVSGCVGFLIGSPTNRQR